MSQSVNVAYVQKFNSGIRLLQQQMDQRLRAAVMVDDAVPGDREFYDQLNATSMTEVTNRHGDTTYTDTPHARRMLTMKTYDVADLVDRRDIRRLLNNPINGYSRSFAAAANRQFDQIILDSLDISSGTGVDGQTGVALPAGQKIDGDGTTFSAAGEPMTIGGMTAVRLIFEQNECMEDAGDNEWFMCLSAKSRQQLLDADPTAGSTVTNSDYAAVKALVNGQINQFLGFSFLKSQLPAFFTGVVRKQFAWVKSSVQLGISEDSRSFMDVLPTKKHSTQVRHEMDAGATRMDEKGVMLIAVDEAA